MNVICTRSNNAHKTLIRFLCLQDMRKDCSHPGDAIDPHLVCHKCQEKAKGKDGLCTEQFPCDQCRHLDSAGWAKLIRLREKREKRRQRSQEASTLRATKALSDCMRSNTSGLSIPDTPDKMPDRDPVTEKRERTKKRDESSFEKFTSPDGARATKDDRRSSKGEKRSHSSSEYDSEQESRSGRKVVRARRRSSPAYDDRYDSRRYGPPPPPPMAFDHYGRPIQYQYYPDNRQVPPQGRSRSPGNSQFTWRDSSAYERRSVSRRPQRDRSTSRRPRSRSPQRSSRARESTKRSKAVEVVSDSLDESDDQRRSPVRRSRPNVKHTARTSSPAASQRAPPVVPDDDTGVDVLRTPKERSAPSARGEDTAAKRNLDFSDTGEASETEQGDSQEDTEFPFKDVIRLIARKSEADIKDVQTKAQKRKLTLLSDENTEEPADYAALTTASGIVAGVDAWFEEFFERDVTNAKGKPVRYKDMFRSKVLRPALKTYKEGDTRVRLAALDKPKKSYSWLPTPSKRHSISDQDLQYFEELARGGLRVVSFKELVNQALNASLADRGSDAERLHRCSKEANKELLRIFTCLLGTCTQMRRDDVVSRIQDTLTTAQRARLRHADVVTETELFPPELLDELDKEFQSTLTTKAMQHTLRNTSATGRGRSANSGDARGKSTDKKKEKADSGTLHHRPAQGQSR